MKKRLKVIFVIIVTVFIISFIGISMFTGFQVFTGSTQLVTNEGTSDVGDNFWNIYDVDYDEFVGTYKVEKIEISSSFQEHKIPADYIYSNQSNNKKDHQTIILVHGLGGNRYTNYPLADYFLELGYNVLTYDQRSSGENIAKYTTFGYWEKYDLIDWLHYIKEQAPNETIGIWGTSFGGATTGLALGFEDTEEKVDFAILDCPISNMEWMIEDNMKDMDTGIPISYMTWCGNIINKLKLGFNYSDADVASEISEVQTPILIINSKADKLTPYFMGKNIYDAIQGNNKDIWTVEDSEHAEQWLDYNEEYRESVDDFLSKYTE